MEGPIKPYFEVYERDDSFKVKDIQSHFVGHSIKKLDKNSLDSWKDEWRKTMHTQELFTQYKTPLDITKNSYEECSEKEKMTLLWRFLLKNTRFAKEKEIWLRLVLAKWTGQNLNTLRKEGKEKI
jgi:hypothetical protein